MVGSEGDNGPPDSWELADLDETMSRLLISSSSSRKSPPPEFADEVGEPARSPLSAAVPASESFSSQAAAVDQVDQFLREALEKPRERLAILRMEQEIEKFISNPAQQELELQPLPNSYLRLAAHRIAQHYLLQSIAVPDNSSCDGSSSRIFVRKTPACGSPQIRLADIPVNLPRDEGGSAIRVAIKRRPQRFPQGANPGDPLSSARGDQLKSVEERKEEYNRARARIFSGSSEARTEGDAAFQRGPEMPCPPEEKPDHEGGGLCVSQGSSREKKVENEQSVNNRYKIGGRVAIFRDREVDRKDPDYDRNYDRYAQRFDPGFGFGGAGAYGIQPLYAPVVNYNTEFPQLGSSHVAQMPVGPWGGAGSPSAAVLPPFGPSAAGSLSSPPVYLPSPPYHTPQPRGGPRPAVGFTHRQEPANPVSQSHRQQSEASYGLSRPR